MNVRSFRTSIRRARGTVLLGLAVWAFAGAAAAAPRGPWDVAAMETAPAATWGQTHGVVQEVFFEGEPFQGRPTRVFAYYGRPEGDGPFPGVVLVHGGGGTAFPDWVRHWVQRGYAAIAMDLNGSGPGGRLPEGGPAMNDAVIFRDFSGDDVRDMWTHHAVAAVIRAHSLLRSRPEVDRERTAITGISWGGYLTCIVAGLDRRFKAAVPVYGCGFIHESSHWVATHFNAMSEAQRQRWAEQFDPSRYLGQAECPMLFVNGTNDFAYPLDSYRKSYRLVRSPVTIAVDINRPHSHIWTFKEVDVFVDSHLTGGTPLPELGAMEMSGATVSAAVKSPAPVTKAELCFTTDAGPWKNRRWQAAPAEQAGDRVTASLPEARPLVCYLRVTDERRLSVSTAHLELPGDETAAAPDRPFWESRTMENEPVLFMKAQDDAPAVGTLLFTPSAPPRLTSPDGATVYEEGRDYTWTPGAARLELIPGSRIPFKTAADMIRPNGGPNTFHGVFHSEGRFFHDLQTQVTYAHDGGWAPPPPERSVELTRSLRRLGEKQPFKIVALGDSITEGYNASGFRKVDAPPHQPAYPELVAAALQRRFSTPVTLVNLGLGGAQAGWGLGQVGRVVAEKPDLVILAFGMNHSEPAPAFEDVMRRLLEAVRTGAPEADVILVAGMTGNPRVFPPERFIGYRDALRRLEAEHVTVADVTTPWMSLLERKPYADLSGNHVNHPNDFGHRLYAQIIGQLFEPPRIEP
jgi:dienelactone hydrolase/lysophospholipase L1-like esterase